MRRAARGRTEGSQSGSRDRVRAEAPAPAGIGPVTVLSLQRVAGNRAFARAVAPSAPTRRAAKQTGLRDTGPLEAYTTAAVAFWRDGRNADEPLEKFAMHLVALANAQLGRLGCPAVHPGLARLGAAAAQFNADLWTLELDPSRFSSDPDANTVGAVSLQDAAAVAGRVYHEARHAEQNFRVARMHAGRATSRVAAEIADHVIGETGIEADVAGAAAANPLTATKRNAHLLGEAEAWHDIKFGTHRIYRDAIGEFRVSAREAAVLVRDADEKSVDQAKERLGRKLGSWNRADGLVDFLDEHVRTIILRQMNAGDALVLENVQNVERTAKAVKEAWKELESGWGAADAAGRLTALKALLEPLTMLNRALYRAYTDQPLERDAWDAGLAVDDRFRALAAKKTAKSQGPG